jgi:hypothetical protein
MLTRPYTIPHLAAKIVRRVAEQGNRGQQGGRLTRPAIGVLGLAGLFPLDLNRHVRQ